MWKNHWNIARIGRDTSVQRWVDGVDNFSRTFWLSLTLCPNTLSHKKCTLCLLSTVIGSKSNSLLLVKLHCFSHLLSLWKSPSSWSKKMPRMVSFQKNIKRYQRVLGYMFLIIMVLITHLRKCPCVPVNYFCAFSDSLRRAVNRNWQRHLMDDWSAGYAEACL